MGYATATCTSCAYYLPPEFPGWPGWCLHIVRCWAVSPVDTCEEWEDRRGSLMGADNRDYWAEARERWGMMDRVLGLEQQSAQVVE